uniref:Nucleotide-diphospho-sugar transferase domain-containing protein n=1 Tax=Haptolina ericina TaxID=156174 RepID=A0A7S3F5P6_9EUKA|mmetsp:Transcript_51091/g.114875  ORF Transcript_51091/g.114875 Transcript_51091/m.114875 type:complete len:364 (+) Transcript_51091:1-1092(+)
MLIRSTDCVCSRDSTWPFACAGCGIERIGLNNSLVIALSLHFDPAHMRSGSIPPEGLYEKHANALLRAHAGLLLVNTTLPVHVLLTGWHNTSFVEMLHGLGMIPHHYRSVPAPQWAKLWYRGNFNKLNLLILASALHRRVLYLDNDVVPFRNIDHLQLSPAPAFVFRNHTEIGVNGGMMLLPVLSAAEVEAAFRLLQMHLVLPFEHNMVGNNGGEQTFWNAWLQQRPRRQVWALPSTYNLYTDAVEKGYGPWWDEVFLWHKPLEKGFDRLPAPAKAHVEARLRRVAEYAPQVNVARERERQPRQWCEDHPTERSFHRRPTHTLRCAATRGQDSTGGWHPSGLQSSVPDCAGARRGMGIRFVTA